MSWGIDVNIMWGFYDMEFDEMDHDSLMGIALYVWEVRQAARAKALVSPSEPFTWPTKRVAR